MTAAVLYGSEDLRIEKIDVPALSPTKSWCAFAWLSPMVLTSKSGSAAITPK